MSEEILHTNQCSKRFSDAEIKSQINLNPDSDCPRCCLNAAAPDLLEACKNVWDDIKGLSPSDYVKIETKNKIEAAIAKAKKE